MSQLIGRRVESTKLFLEHRLSGVPESYAERFSDHGHAKVI